MRWLKRCKAMTYAVAIVDGLPIGGVGDGAVETSGHDICSDADKIYEKGDIPRRAGVPAFSTDEIAALLPLDAVGAAGLVGVRGGR